ncbi:MULTISPECIES: Rv2175c family DNA-binding protein [unclassified Arthrobacter]|uniref:Rv2175c family DNA-binding protein n=1 Tax=unclassified Arthrobacter TaxID=235627 RepID=UPI001D15708F|nr:MULTISPECIES: Rv2175c family DNA-binding protein [unclassified Arthrobacter]MCC3279699.1 DNA-binding protein [Arthrobacter sp. zg-Y40]MCC9178100.1 DNA-binding protein [Arthrobacter sp. zg-Y750]MCC3274307.1 DNA-binding protein [Arthrobacter sp. zg-Y20]MDK1314463.1 Rv2175c family DNA-binding protein [Arthrobacter sp. zg.Y20]MDK1327349.1 Rv2175c family DNA-binding protein [Arthrobacter sp. zg-Y1143]
MNELQELVSDWLTLPDVAEQLDLPINKVHSLLEERALVAVRLGERKIRSVPAAFIADGAVLDSLKGTISVLNDAGFHDDEMIRWLFTADDTLPGRPVDALREGRKTEIRRRAQALAW